MSTANCNTAATGDINRAASVLRVAGAGAVLLSAVVYMLQGVEHIGLDLRQWVYLALIGLLAGTGVVVRHSFADARSARLCFALAALALVAQVAQVAGMVHELASAGGVGASWFGDFSGTTAAIALAAAAVAALLFLPVAFTAFSILQRVSARALTFVFGLSLALLLLPARDGLGALLVLVVLAGVWFAAERFVVRAQASSRTLEGYGARGVLAAPLAVALVRHAFHITDVAGCAALILLLAAATLLFAHMRLARGPGRDVLSAIVALIAGLAWAVLTHELLPPDHAASTWVAVLPVSVLLLILARFSGPLTPAFRVFAVAIAVLPSISVLSDAGTIAEALLLTVVGLALAGWGAVWRERETFVPGAAVALAGSGLVVIEAFARVDVNTWLSLAVGGVLLVLAASVIERHGRHLAGRLRAGWREVSAWR